MPKFKTVSGIGFIKNKEGKIVSKYSFLPASEHEYPDGYTMQDVGTEDEFKAITIDPGEPTKDKHDEDLIQKTIRELAVREIKKTNPGFEDPAKKPTGGGKPS